MATKLAVRPLGGNVVVSPLKKEEVTASGIVLPSTVSDKEEKGQGVVLAVGPGKLLENGTRSAIEVAVGDSVIFKSWGGDKVELGGEEYKILSADDILAVLEK